MHLKYSHKETIRALRFYKTIFQNFKCKIIPISFKISREWQSLCLNSSPEASIILVWNAHKKSRRGKKRKSSFIHEHGCKNSKDYTIKLNWILCCIQWISLWANWSDSGMQGLFNNLKSIDSPHCTWLMQRIKTETKAAA